MRSKGFVIRIALMKSARSLNLWPNPTKNPLINKTLAKIKLKFWDSTVLKIAPNVKISKNISQFINNLMVGQLKEPLSIYTKYAKNLQAILTNSYVSFLRVFMKIWSMTLRIRSCQKRNKNFKFYKFLKSSLIHIIFEI
jgi:hypothetical protein